MSIVLNASPHVLMDVASCETKAWLRHVRGYTSPGEAIRAVAGQAIHAAIANYLDPRSSEEIGKGSVMQVFHNIYDPAFARLTPEKLDPSLTPANLHRLLSCWIEMHPPTALPWKRVVEVETAFESRRFPMPNGDVVRLIVRPDIIVEDNDGRYRWVDTKTTGWRVGDTGWQNQLCLSSQTQLYSDAMAQRYGDRAVLGGWVAAVEIKTLPGASAPKIKKDGTPAKPRLCEKHGRPYAECWNEPPHVQFPIIPCLTTPMLVARAVADAERAAVTFHRLMTSEPTIEMLAMNGSENGNCRFCPGQEFCLASRPVAAIENMLVYEPYLVSEGTR